MDMLDVRKVTRGITFWREDILKWEKTHNGESINAWVRDALHNHLSKVVLDNAGLKELEDQIVRASNEREARKKGRRTAPEKRECRSSTRKIRKIRSRRMAVITEGMTIPKEIRNNPKFVSSKNGTREAAKAS